MTSVCDHTPVLFYQRDPPRGSVCRPRFTSESFEDQIQLAAVGKFLREAVPVEDGTFSKQTNERMISGSCFKVDIILSKYIGVSYYPLGL